MTLQALTLPDTLLLFHKNPLVKERIEEEIYEWTGRKSQQQKEIKKERKKIFKLKRGKKKERRKGTFQTATNQPISFRR